MKINNPKTSTSRKSQVISIIAWALIIFTIYELVTKTQGSINDLIALKNRGNVPIYMLIIAAIFMLAISLLPLAFSIGLLLRKNWGRIGVIFVSIFAIGMNVYYMFLTKLFYPQQYIGIIFFLVVLGILGKEKYKKEFIVIQS